MKRILLAAVALCSDLGAQQTPDLPSSLSSHNAASVSDTLSPTLEKRRDIDEIIISGTLKPVLRTQSPVPVEVYNRSFFKKNPGSNIVEGLQAVNGVRPSINCNVCGTSDLRINGLEGPYTMVLIDGMPIMSSLGAVYGLSGIPQSLLERVEIVKGPASSLYGSEAVAGLVNIITRNPDGAPKISADVQSSSWAEHNMDLGIGFGVGEKANALTGINLYSFQKIVDKNGDGFTDMPLQNRFSVFQKWNFKRKENRLFSLSGRYLYEDRWGGQTHWHTKFRGGNQVYAESIYTSRAEVLGAYQLPVKDRVVFSFSIVGHNQNSHYGDTPYLAKQNISFGQLIWDRKVGKHDLLLGGALRHTYYDDNTPATASLSGDNQPEHIWLPGIFIQDEIQLSPKHKVLAGLRYDFNSAHGSIFTPRLAYKWAMDSGAILRLNAGTGFRVVNLFTEDHAALTGARKVVILENLKPEKSWNLNLNWTQKFNLSDDILFGVDASAFFTHFDNRILPDYLTDPTQIRYANTLGYARSMGISLNTDLNLPGGLKLMLGGTLMDNFQTDEEGKKIRPVLTENFSGTWALSYRIQPWHLNLDYTGNIQAPMLMPTLGPTDPRPEKSPWWSIQNVQFTYDGIKNLEIFGGVKNLLDWVPFRGLPFLVARADDPFNTGVEYDSQGQVIATPSNPYALQFDPAYAYAPNQGIRGFLGIRYTFK